MTIRYDDVFKAAGLPALDEAVRSIGRDPSSAFFAEPHRPWADCDPGERVSWLMAFLEFEQQPPFNLALHECLMRLGYSYQRVAADWEDDGDAENGPHLSGHDAFDEYEDADSRVYCSEGGDTGFEWRDLQAEEAAERMGGEQ